mgnify:FL=1|jgi:hypothetical protein
MKALEFQSKIKNNQIDIPSNVQSKLNGEDVRVIVLLKDSQSDEDDFKTITKTAFLKGYDEADSIYDDY